jgi:putative hydrolase of the HAD superfamily
VRSAAVIFDGDDTLWETMPAYTRAKHGFFREMALVGFNEQEVELHFEKIDIANVDRLGFSRERFFNSMIETYHCFCRRSHVETSKSIEDKIRSLGHSVVSSPSKVHKSAHQVLGQLQIHYRLILATKGDKEVQLTKIKESNLGSYFDKTYIFDQKTERELNLVLEDNELSRADSWAVGNSLRSDINPALRIGLKAIWIPRYTWDYEEDEHKDSRDLFIVKSLRDCLEILIPSGSLLVSA